MSDNPILRKLLQVVTVKRLSKYDSKDSGWHSESSKTAEIKVLDAQIGSITATVETWAWLDDPDHNLSLEVTQFDLTGGQITFGVDAKADVSVWAWGQIPNVVKAEVGGSAYAYFAIAGSTQVVGDGLSRTEITSFDINLSDLRFDNDILNALSDPIQSSLNNGWFIDKDARADELKAAIDGITF